MLINLEVSLLISLFLFLGAFASRLEVRFKRIELSLNLIKESDVILQCMLLLLVSLVLPLVLKLVFLTHLLMHLMCFVLHLPANLTLASHLVPALLLFALLAFDRLIHHFTFLFFPNILASSVDTPDSLSLQRDRLGLQLLQEPMHLSFLPLL